MAAALKELEVVRGQEEQLLEQRTAQLQREYESRMAALERRFLSEAEALQAQLREGVHRETLLCQAGIESKTKELMGTLGAGSFAASAAVAAAPRAGMVEGARARSSGIQARLNNPTSPAGKAPLPAGVEAAAHAVEWLRPAAAPQPSQETPEWRHRQSNQRQACL